MEDSTSLRFFEGFLQRGDPHFHFRGTFFRLKVDGVTPMFEVIEQTIPNEMHVEHPLPTGFLVALCQTLFELYPSTLTQVCNDVSYNLMDKIFWSLIFGSVVFPVCCLS